MKSRIVILALTSMSLACGRATSEPGGASSWGLSQQGWQSAAESLGSSSSSVFSLYFYGTGEKSFGASMVIFPAGQEMPCQFVTNQLTIPDPISHWVLDIDLGSLEAGAYTVEPTFDSTSLDTEKAQAYLKLIENNDVSFKYLALGGKFNLVSEMDSEAGWSSGIVSMQGFLDFPLNPVQEIACSLGGDDNGDVWGECSCERENRSTFVCEWREGSSCCIDTTQETVRIPVNVPLATQCTSLCVSTSAIFAHRCEDELESSGQH